MGYTRKGVIQYPIFQSINVGQSGPLSTSECSGLGSSLLKPMALPDTLALNPQFLIHPQFCNPDQVCPLPPGILNTTQVARKPLLVSQHPDPRYFDEVGGEMFGGQPGCSLLKNDAPEIHSSAMSQYQR